MIKRIDDIAKFSIGTISFVSIFVLFFISVMLFSNALPIFQNHSFLEVLLGEHWRPDSTNPEYGMLPLITGSLLVTLIALLFSVPLGLLTSIYLYSIKGTGFAEILKPIIEILGSIPSVVYGLIGLVILAPFFQSFLTLSLGQCALVAGITLGIMILPIIATVAEEALSSVSKDLYEAALSLGSTSWEAINKVVFPAARNGLINAVLLTFGRAIGETMTVLMVAGGAAQITLSIFDPVRPMTLTIAAEMGETPVNSEHYYALFAVGGVLFIITLIINVIANYYAKRSVKN